MFLEPTHLLPNRVPERLQVPDLGFRAKTRGVQLSVVAVEVQVEVDEFLPMGIVGDQLTVRRVAREDLRKQRYPFLQQGRWCEAGGYGGRGGAI